MLIRSQNKLELVPLNQHLRVLIDEDLNLFQIGYWDIWQGEDYFDVLGNYSTKEKAMQVLDMIEKEYSKYMTVMGGPALVKGGMDVQPAIYNIPKVFHMPQDDEVPDAKA